MIRWACPLLVLSLTACAMPAERDEGSSIRGAVDGKADLPNGDFYAREYDGRWYGAIAKRFTEFGYDITSVDMSLFEARWPIDDPHTAVFARQGTPTLLGSSAYCHTGLDVHRSDPTNGSDLVYAPISGMAFVTDWSGEPTPNGNTGGAPGDYGARWGDYQTVVSIWDPESHAVVELMHVEPDPSIVGHDEPFPIRAGDVVGRFAPLIDVSDDPAVMETYRHTHVNIVDVESGVLENPARHLPYQDHQAPAMLDAYVLDADADVQAGFGGAGDDLVLEIVDRDDLDVRNFEIAALSYEIVDETGEIVAQLERCELSDLFARFTEVESDRALSIFDFGNAAHQVEESPWRRNDTANADRTFRYAITQLAQDDEGRCVAQGDDEGALRLPEGVTEIVVRGTLWDHNDNGAPFEARLAERQPEEPEEDL